MNTIKLSRRLQMIADMVETGASVADIGTDHGYIPIYLVQNGLSSHVIASDIKKGPIESAKRSGKQYCVSDRIKYICAPGLDGVEENEVDTVIIAGMGGETIVSILDNADWIDNGVKLILQPQSKVEYLRHYLNDRGFFAKNAHVVVDAGKNYIAIEAVKEKYVSEPFFINLLKDEPFKADYINELIKKHTIRLTGLKRTTGNEDLISEYERILFYLNSSLGE